MGQKDRSEVSLMTAINVCIILPNFFFVGEYVLRIFGTISTFKPVEFLIVSSGFGLLNTNQNERYQQVEEDKLSNSIALTPLAMPMLAPGSISLIAFTKIITQLLM